MGQECWDGDQKVMRASRLLREAARLKLILNPDPSLLPSLTHSHTLPQPAQEFFSSHILYS